MDLFLKVDEYLSKPLEDIIANYLCGSRGYSLKTQILIHPADARFSKEQVKYELMVCITNASKFYDNWLKIFRDSPGFFVEDHKSSDFEKIIDNIDKKNEEIIQSFGREIWKMLMLKFERENVTEVERDTLVKWLSEL